MPGLDPEQLIEEHPVWLKPYKSDNNLDECRLRKQSPLSAIDFSIITIYLSTLQ